MKEQLLNLKTEALNRLKECNDNADIEKIRIQYLGKKGELTAILRSMGSLPEEERPEAGKLANEVRALIEEAIQSAKEAVHERESEKRLKKENPGI